MPPLAGFKVLYQSSGRYDDLKILRAAAGALVARAVPAVLGDLMLPVFQIQQGMMRFCRPQNDVAALTAITAIRTAFGDELFPPEAHASRAAVSPPDKYLCFVNKSHTDITRVTLQGMVAVPCVKRKKALMF